MFNPHTITTPGYHELEFPVTVTHILVYRGGKVDPSINATILIDEDTGAEYDLGVYGIDLPKDKLGKPLKLSRLRILGLNQEDALIITWSNA